MVLLWFGDPASLPKQGSRAPNSLFFFFRLAHAGARRVAPASAVLAQVRRPVSVGCLAESRDPGAVVGFVAFYFYLYSHFVLLVCRPSSVVVCAGHPAFVVDKTGVGFRRGIEPLFQA
jgi:hypothetical protein